MCEAIEKLGEIFAEKARIEARIEMIKDFLNSGASEEDAINILKVSSEEIEKAKALMLQSI